MTKRLADAYGDAAADLLERRWFAANNAAVALRGECEALMEVLELAEIEWRGARERLARLEALRDSLGEELAIRDAERELLSRVDGGRTLNSAA